jgi:hypothetical protein
MFDKLRTGSRKVLEPFQAQPPTASAGIQRIELDYPIHPRTRWLRSGRAGERLVERIAASIPAAQTLFEQTARFHEQFLTIPVEPPPGADQAGPHWNNGWFHALDAVTLYGLLALRNPRVFVEVGSGNSTRFARRAIRDHELRTKIISIDPCPRAEIDAICDQMVRAPFEDLDTKDIADLTSEDLLFVDSSHRSFQNSDVTVFFTEILPALPPGLVYGMHDIYLPNDYPPEWVGRFYNEQYLLACYLSGGAGGDEVLAPLAYLHHDTKLPATFARTFDQLGLTPSQRFGNAFWMRKGAH